MGGRNRAISTGSLTPYSSLDYNGYRRNHPEPTQFIRWFDGKTNHLFVRSLEEFAKVTGHERHGIEVDYDAFIRGAPPQKGVTTELEQWDLRLRPGSRAVDAGVRLPNINDDFTGKGPDLGAHEQGQPLPHYGPREGHIGTARLADANPAPAATDGARTGPAAGTGDGASSPPLPAGGDRMRLPKTDSHWRRVESYVEHEPDADYQHAPAAAREAFGDLKYGIRIHWGLYSMLGDEASWELLKMPPEKKQDYINLYRTFNPTGFNADEWMDLFKRNGVRVFAFTAKHHDGFSMFDTKARVRQCVNWTAPGGPRLEACDRAFSIMEGPFQRDIVKELCEAARRHDLKINLYYSHPDWFDADFRPYCYHPLQTPSTKELTRETAAAHERRSGGQRHPVVPDPTPEETQRMMARHRAQLAELLTNYGPIDQICLDMWLGPAAWPPLRETVKYLRTLQPNVMFRARGIGNYGDYYTPEGFVPASPENTGMPWMVIYPLAGIFAYQPDAAKYKGGDWLVRNLVDSVAKGGNFMFAIGPDANGKFHPKAIAAMEEAGAWLRVNGEAIYPTRSRPGDLWHEGEDIRFTRTKDNRFLYAFCLKWPGEKLVLRTVRAQRGSKITMLGVTPPLDWRQDGDGALVIDTPPAVQNEANRPCRHVFALKIAAEGESQ
ncbi:MAG: hypothetical protein FJ224_10405 [Lentisphaerae bacterium]|nr:hypothetical protein [Lentisphaerota bacterium]